MKCPCKASKTHPGLLLATGLQFGTLEYFAVVGSTEFLGVRLLLEDDGTKWQPFMLFGDWEFSGKLGSKCG